MGFKQQVGLMAQGQQRALDPSGHVSALKQPSPHLQVCPWPVSRARLFTPHQPHSHARPGIYWKP